MVVFTCQHCGDPVKKPGVQKHYNTKCRYKTPYLTCVDCLKDFSCDAYVSHNQCMTEDQRYSAQGSVFKEQKGKKKQEMYIEMIHRVLDSADSTLLPVHKELLKTCSYHENVPRKLKKFENFIRNASRSQLNIEDVHFVFNVIEDAWQKESHAGIAKDKGPEEKVKHNPQEEYKSNLIVQNEKNIDGTTDQKAKFRMCHKSKKNRSVDTSFSIDNEDSIVTTDEKTCNGFNTTFSSDQSDLKKSNKKRKSDEFLSINETDQRNLMSNSESRKEENEVMHNNKPEQTKKDKQRRKSLSLNHEDSANPGKNFDIQNIEKCIDSKGASNDEINENVNKVSKKQLKKQKKYEKYLAELENEAKSETIENGFNADTPESTDTVKNKKKNKKLNATKFELEYPGLVETKNVVNVNDSTLKKDVKKRKLEECVDETPEKKIKEISKEGKEELAVAVFNWGDVITSVLQSRPDKELSLKKLGKKVINEYQSVKQDHRTHEELLAKFNKKINKVKGVRVLRDRAKLIE